MAKKTKKTGRPTRHPGQRLSKNRTFRIRGDLDEKLERAAKESERSVSEEIEQRLAETFHDQLDWRIARSLATALSIRKDEGGEFAAEAAWFAAVLECVEIMLHRSPFKSSRQSKAYRLIESIARRFDIKVEITLPDLESRRQKLAREIKSTEDLILSLNRQLEHLEEEARDAASDARRDEQEQDRVPLSVRRQK